MWSYLWSPLPSLSIGIIPGNLLSLWFLHRRCCLGSILWIRVIGTHWCCFPPQSHILFPFHFRCNSRGMIGRCFWRVRFLLDVLQGLRLIMVFCRSCWCQNCQNGKLSTQTWKEDGKYKFHFFICILHILYIIVKLCECLLLRFQKLEATLSSCPSWHFPLVSWVNFTWIEAPARIYHITKPYDVSWQTSSVQEPCKSILPCQIQSYFRF